MDQGGSRMPSRFRLGAMLAFPLCLVAQTQRGTIVGTITDATGAVVPDAKVEVVNAETNAKFEATSNQAGYYSALYLPYGQYTIKVNAAGFRTYSVTGVGVATATTSTVNVTLSVESQAQEVQVQASPVILETTTSSVGTNVEQKLKDDLPVVNRRNPLAYLQTVPGFQPSNQTTL
ncbi:MAG: carboxypeptidase regulatory-like domain-containing protein, partial [Acidobacteria bacterium]|nr:carboxypeptidase regulatory-like domain-containing protein [Acidobacteriota bacterium]